MNYGKFELITIDDAWNKATRGHTKVRATKLERVGPGTRRIERRKKVAEEEIEKAKADVKGLEHWAQDYKEAKKAGNLKLAKEIKTNIITALKKLPTKELFEMAGKFKDVLAHPGKREWLRTRRGKMETVHRRKAGVEKFRGGVGVKFDRPPKVEKFRGGVGIRFN